jgi:hypothetical protein
MPPSEAYDYEHVALRGHKTRALLPGADTTTDQEAA